MSNTFKTKPYWVQLANGYHRSVPVHAVEGEHDCDLPDKARPRADALSLDVHLQRHPDLLLLDVPRLILRGFPEA